MVYIRNAQEGSSARARVLRQLGQGPAEPVPTSLAQVLRQKDKEISWLRQTNNRLTESQAEAEDAADAAKKQAQQAKEKLAKTKSKLTDLQDAYDTLEGVNQNLRQALEQAEARAEEAENQARLARVEAEQTSLVKVLEEELDASKRALDAQAQQVEDLQRSLSRVRGHLSLTQAALEEAEKAEAGLIAEITPAGVTLHGHLAEAEPEQITRALGQAFALLGMKGHASEALSRPES